MRLRLHNFFLLLLSFMIVSFWFFHMTSRPLAACKSQPEMESQRHVSVPSAIDLKYLKTARKPMDANLSSFGSVCHTPKCLALYNSVYQHSDQRIPNIRHILWKGGNVSAYFAKQLRTWNATHPDWTYVLWRDSDLEKFVAKHYTGALSKFKSLPMNIMRIDMIRYMILHRYGGVYADLDYVLVRSLNRFMKLPAVISRETEAHAFFYHGMKTFPPPFVGNPALMMSVPRHPFFEFCNLQLIGRPADNYFMFAGPLGLAALLEQYSTDFRINYNPDGVVIVPASRNFYGFESNSLASSTSNYKGYIIGRLNQICGELKNQSVAKNVTTYCKDVSNLDPITDRNELMYAIHDSNKPRSSYDPAGSPIFHDNPVDIRTILTNVVMADTIY